MPNELQIKSPEGDVINRVPATRRLIKGIAGPPLEVVVVSLSEDTFFSGAIVVEPFFGRNYSEDLEIAMIDGPWTNRLDIEIWPDIDYHFRFRTSPETTPAPGTGRAAISIVGDWFPIVPVVS